jgi:hypothetical protein
VSLEQNIECAGKLRQLPLANYVAVVGSGLSHNIAVNMGELINKMESATGLPRVKNVSGDEPQWAFFDRIYLKDSQLYHNILKESFNQTKPYEGKAYKNLVQIPFRSFVTLNYDELLPKAFYAFTLQRKSKFRFSVYPSKNQIYFPSDFSDNNQCLVAIHGCKNESDALWYEHLILRWEDYKTHYEGNGPHPTFLQMWWYWLLTTWPCMFIGTSLQEPGLNVTIANIVEHNNESVKKLKHIHLTHEQTGVKFGVIEQFIYDKVDEEHSGLVNVLMRVLGIEEAGPPVTELRKIPLTQNISAGNEPPGML